MLRSKKVATPPTAATAVVPLSVPPPGLAPSATLTLPVNPGTRFPSASSARTFTAGLIWRPAIERKSVVWGRGVGGGGGGIVSEREGAVVARAAVGGGRRQVHRA